MRLTIGNHSVPKGILRGSGNRPLLKIGKRDAQIADIA